jgi:predicted Na+-dependent transporter
MTQAEKNPYPYSNSNKRYHTYDYYLRHRFGGKVAKLPKKDCRTLSIEIGIQNSGLALALLFNPAIFDPGQWKSNGGIVIIAALWGIWHIISGLGISYKFRHKDL